jgi:hypothetical protein
MNLIGNNDAGRYDLSAGPGGGGSNFTNYNAALAAYGSATVLRFAAVLDSFGGADKTLIINEIGGEAQAQGGVPEPMSAFVWCTLALTAFGFAGRRRQANAA